MRRAVLRSFPKALLPAIAACGLTISPVAAEDFSAGSEAKEWGLSGEQKARFNARVVDLLCELTGDCPADCGDGRRQLGLLRSDQVLVLPLKNRQAAFTGAATDLLPFCGKDVEVDGVLVGDEDETPVKYYMVQTIREQGTAEWTKTDQWTRTWARNNPEAEGKGPWFRRDPRVKAKISESGYLGLGAETDAAFIKYYFE